MNYIEPITCKCGIRVQIHEYPMDLGDDEPRDRGYCPMCCRFLFEMARPGILVTEVILPGDRTKCADGHRHLGLPAGYDDEDWPFPTLAELLRRQEGP